jgi:DNA end-binding protein Ku
MLAMERTMVYSGPMAARPIASGTISFGLVAIPVKLFSTNESSAKIQLNSIHEKCGTRVRQQFWCPTAEEVVTRDELVRGYEFAKNQYVLFSPDELKSMEVAPTQSIDIKEFVPLAQVDPLYFEKAYYLGPDKGGDKPYRLLAEAMKQTERAAIAKYAARGKDYLVLLRPFEGGLLMQQLKYNDEIRDFADVPLGESTVEKAELALATQIVDQIASDEFKPGIYADGVRTEMLAAIETKVEGQELTISAPDETKAEVIDLMDALKASLAASAEGDSERKSAKKTSRETKAKKRVQSKK